jgi:hypothetical protein
MRPEKEQQLIRGMVAVMFFLIGGAVGEARGRPGDLAQGPALQECQHDGADEAKEN